MVKLRYIFRRRSMNPEQLVATQETCHRARKLGWKKETYFVWFSNLFVTGGKYAEELYADYDDRTVYAPTLHEVLGALPKWTVCFFNETLWVVRANSSPFNVSTKSHPNPAEAALQLWCKLQESSQAATELPSSAADGINAEA